MADSILLLDDPNGSPNSGNLEESQSPELANNVNSDADLDEVEVPLKFSQIRQKFEEKCKPKLKYVKPPLIRGTQTLDEDMRKAKVPSEFQKLYPSFKECFTKRQFAAIETCFNLADANQDGFLEPKEVKQLMIDCQQPVNLSEADLIVSLGDHDQDGKLSAKEFLELCKPSAEVLREHYHMEGSRAPSNEEFALILIQKLRTFASPVNSRVKGARQFFENMIGSSSLASLCSNVKETSSTPIPSRKPLSKLCKSLGCSRNLSENEAKRSPEIPKLSKVGGIIVLEETEEIDNSCQLPNYCC